MGRSSKKSTKVDAAPAVVAPPTKPLKKGKREAEEAIEKLVATKKQKKDETALKQAITKQKIETKTKKKNQKEESSSSSEEDSSSDYEEEIKAALAAKQPLMKPSDSSSEEDSSSSDEDITVKSVAPSKNDIVGKPATKGKVASISSDISDSDSEDHEKTKSKVPVKNVPVAAATKKNDVSSDDSDDSSSSDDDKSAKVASQAKKSTANAAKNGSVVVTKNKEESGDSLESEEESDEEDETSVKVTSKDAPTKVSAVTFKKGKDNTSDSESDDDSDSDEATAPKSAPSKQPSSTTVTKQKVETEEDDSEEESSSESDEEEPDKKKMKVQPNVAKPKQKESSSEEDSSEEESLDEDKNTPKKKNADVEMVDEKSSKTEAKEAVNPYSMQPQTPRTPQVQATGSKTLFVGNLSFAVEQSDVENFFKDAGEIDGIRFAIDRDGIFKGYGHVEFATVKAAQKALELKGQELLGRRVKLDLARERGAFTPTSGNENSYQKGGRALGQTIFVKGFDTSDGEEKIRSALEEHFGSCGDISRVSIPKDYEGGIKGIAYMDFTDSDGVSKALELNGSEFGESKLTVEEAKLRGDSDRGDGGGRFSNRGHGFNGRSGGRGRFGGGDFGGRFSRGGGRGHGGLKRPSMGTAGTGRKTTFDD